MALTPNYTPQFPYRGAQIILTSDRVVMHSKGDAIFLFGKRAIGLSSPGRVNIDTAEGTTVNAPEIELGLNAKTKGEPVAKARTLANLLNDLLSDLERTATALSNLSASGLEESVVDIVKESAKLKGKCVTIRSQLENIKSNVTYTI